MHEAVSSFAMSKAVGLVFGSAFIATCGLASVIEAMPIGGVNAGERTTIVLPHNTGIDAASIRLVGTRDHDDDPTPDGSTQQMNNPKKKTDQSMKSGSGSKGRDGQGSDGHANPKKNKSVKPDQQDNEGDRPDDRRQGANVDPKP